MAINRRPNQANRIGLTAGFQVKSVGVAHSVLADRVGKPMPKPAQNTVNLEDFISELLGSDKVILDYLAR